MTSISNITEAPIDLMALIGEFSGNIDFLPAVSNELAEKNLHKAAEKISTLAAELAPCLAMSSLLAEEESLGNEITDLEKRDKALEGLVVKYSKLAETHRLLKTPEKIKLLSEVKKVAKTLQGEKAKEIILIGLTKKIVVLELVQAGKYQEALEMNRQVVEFSKANTLNNIAENYREEDVEDAFTIADLIGS
ncbi:MAG: hypothetical protein PVI40_06115 [Chlamydiota bacterium]|jgi:hypothetical protein